MPPGISRSKGSSFSVSNKNRKNLEAIAEKAAANEKAAAEKAAANEKAAAEKAAANENAAYHTGFRLHVEGESPVSVENYKKAHPSGNGNTEFKNNYYNRLSASGNKTRRRRNSRRKTRRS